MKNRFIGIILFFLIVGIFLGCQDSDNINEPNNHINGSGKIVTETRNLDDCSGISLLNIGKVYLTQADEQSILVEADDNVIGLVITRKENGLLQVGLPDGSYSNVTLRVYVSLKTIDNISIEGAGDVECQQPIFDNDLYCSINGAGSIILNGNGKYLNTLINGAGNINAKEFTVENCNTVVNGAGSCIVYVTNELDAYVTGVGNVIYYGNPGIVKSSISGLGQIKAGL